MYSDEAIRDLVTRLCSLNVTKSECITIINMRPENMAVLLSILEDADGRWSAAKQQEILDMVTTTLGRFPDELREQEEMETGVEESEQIQG